VGEVVGQSIARFFEEKNNRTIIENLRRAGLRLTSEKQKRNDVTADSQIKGTSWVITGTLSQPREEIAELIIGKGGKVTDSVSKKTSYLLAGEEAGSKLQKGQTLGIRIINEVQFRKMIGN